MKPFDFLSQTGLPLYAQSPAEVERLNFRYRFAVQPFLSQIVGADILDLGSHDGHWPYVLAAAGAKSVLGIEGRPEVMSDFARFPHTEVWDRVELQVGDMHTTLDTLCAQGRTIDVITVYGVFYHIMDHFSFLRKLMALKPRLIIVDTLLTLSPHPIIFLMREDSDARLNAISQQGVDKQIPVGYPSRLAIEMMVDSLGWRVDWQDWNTLPQEERAPCIQDYFRSGKPRRFTFSLWPH